jgi:tetratricopeptide (TPR) repeat protein
LLALSKERWAAGDRRGAREAAQDAAQHGRDVGRPELIAEAPVAIAGPRGWSEAGVVDEELIALCEDALARLPPGDSRNRAMVTARLAAELYFRPGSSKRRRAVTNEAVQMARRLGDPTTLAYVLGTAHWGVWVPGGVDERLAIAEEILRLGREAGNREVEFSGASWSFGDLMELGETARADEMLSIELTIADELRQPEYLWCTSVHRSTRLLMAGRYDEAERVANDALAYGEAAQSATAVQMYGVWQLEEGRARGGLEALESVVSGMVEQYPLLVSWRSALVYLYALLDRTDDIVPHLDILAAEGFSTISFDSNWLIGIAVLVYACVAIGDRDRCAQLYDLLLPFREYHVTVGMPAGTVGSAELPLALAAGTVGRWDVADDHFTRAMAANEHAANRIWIVHGKYEYSKLLAGRGDPGDHGRIGELLRSCHAGATDMGMTRVVDQTESLAASVGVALE